MMLFLFLKFLYDGDNISSVSAVFISVIYFSYTILKKTLIYSGIICKG